MNKLSITLGALLLAILALLGGSYLGRNAIQSAESELAIGAANTSVISTFNTTTDSYMNYGTQDVLGTHVGTSTVGVLFPTINATNTYISDIGNATRATYQIKITSVTNTQNNLVATVQGSNDYLCTTQAGNASSTTDVIQSNINWYDAMIYMDNRVHPTSFASASTSLVMVGTNLVAGNALTLDLVGLNFRCLRFLISASSTGQYVGLNLNRL